METAEANHIINRYYSVVLRFCSCDEPEATLDELKDALERIATITRTRDKKWQFKEALTPHLEWFKAHRFLVYSLDALGLTEHGYSIGGGWLTSRGERLLEALRAHTEDWEDSAPTWYAGQEQEQLAEEETFRQEWGRR